MKRKVSITVRTSGRNSLGQRETGHTEDGGVDGDRYFYGKGINRIEGPEKTVKASSVGSGRKSRFYKITSSCKTRIAERKGGFVR